MVTTIFSKNDGTVERRYLSKEKKYVRKWEIYTESIKNHGYYSMQFSLLAISNCERKASVN